MQLHQLRRRTPLKKSRQVGRGGKRGKTSGRGTKGQRARSGRKMRPELRDQIKKIPKQRGYRVSSRQVKPRVLNLSQIEAKFKAGDQVSPATLVAKGLLQTQGGRLPAVKLLAGGTLSKALTFQGLSYSAAVKQKVEAAGGQLS